MATSSDIHKRLRKAHIPSEPAKEPLDFLVSDITSLGAKRKCPTQCVVVKVVRRHKHVINVAVMTKVAHVTRYCPNRKQVINFTYAIRTHLRKTIRTYDKTGVFPPAKYTLHPPPPSEGRARKRDRDDKRPNKPTGKGGGSPKVRSWVRRYKNTFELY